MNSTTGEFSRLTDAENVQKNLHTRNAFSTVKRSCPRRKINIVPLRLMDIERELKEVEREMSTYPQSESEKENEAKEANKITKLHDSFDMEADLAALSLTTPAKSKNNDFTTPRPKPRVTEVSSSKKLDLYITPNNKIPQKIQCSVNMQNYLKTPIDQIGTAQKKLTWKSIQSKVENDVRLEPIIEKPLETSFNKIIVNNVEYVVLNELGKGGSSEVHHCYNLKTKMHCAIKCVSLQNPTSASGFINEVEKLQTLQTCNRIIKMFDFELKEGAKTLLVVLEVGGADLSKILKEFGISTTHMPLYVLIYYWMEMLYAVKQIHSHGIIHADLKPANFLKVEGYLKLIDFGIATCIQNGMTSVFKEVPEGSFNYISPEALNNESSSNCNSPSYGQAKYKISFKSDVWSLGCILYQMVYRKTPFQHVRQIYTKWAMILNPNTKIDYPPAVWVPQKIINTMRSCLQYDTKQRPSIDELISEYENIFQNI